MDGEIAGTLYDFFEGALEIGYDAISGMNVIMTSGGGFVEIQGTAEGMPFTRTELNSLLDLAEKGCREIMAKQTEALAKA